MSPITKFGIIGGLALGIISIIGFLNQPTELELNSSQFVLSAVYFLLNTGIAFTVIYLSSAEKRKLDLDGYMTFGQGFGHSYKTALMVILVNMVILSAYCYVIDPDWYPFDADTMIEFSEESSGNELPDAAKDMMRFQFDHITEITIFGRAFGQLFGFAILSLIAAAALNRQNPDSINL